MYWDTLTVSSNGTAAVVDGCSLNLTNFSRAVVRIFRTWGGVSRPC